MLRAFLFAVILSSVFGLAQTRDPASLDRGYRLLYNLDFRGAEAEFSSFQNANPDNPLGPVSEAASCVFSELNRLGILESRFFTADSAFRSRSELKPDPVVAARFNAALSNTDLLINKRLAENPRDRDALFARTLAAGLRADYTSLIEDRNIVALKFTREATTSAAQLLEIYPDYYDAYVATGISEYLIGSLSAPVRLVVRLGGYSGSRSQGIQHMQLAAERGRYLAPFARILLAIAYVREKRKDEAERVLSQLQIEFPANPLFTKELARLEKH